MTPNSKLINILREINSKGNMDATTIASLSPEEQDLIKNLQTNGLLEEALSYAESIDTDKNWEELEEKLNADKKTIVINWRKIFQYAAIFVCLLGLVYLIQYKTGKQSRPEIPSDAIQLVLENGDIQVLNPNGEQQIIKKNGEVLASQKENEINYRSDKAINKLVYNEIRIPYGKTFKIKLSDGTSVNMNAGSSLKYPVQFIKGHNREVVLEGEAFFDVAKDKAHPFIVKTRGVDVKVLGTKFNVSSYKEDQDINTVLVEGSVSLSDKNNKKAILEPSEKGSWNKEETEIAVEKVDTRFYTEWINGEIVFRKTAFKDIVIKLERTYNVKIENNREDILDKKFNASFNKNIESIDKVLETMSKIMGFTYKKEGELIKIN
ncbi:iron dicitrate transport regulator FecR [Flavobacterium crocinum]|uniref:Iron dicitrate transport regulator FecR n=1 Tax=Flavobacterium crocinum TaxID=2183896 RepID=A0A2S1YGZ2_9FLAO|nr:FecR family protein [Flavobacterium crocinum]AWK03322.1 iron dicitrate transport regulator FecR [Flavobacterium crocinum]